MKILPLLVIIVLLVGMYLFAQRAKQRSADQVASRQSSIVVGSRVMTTSGLYGAVVSMDTDAETVRLAIAPGVEVTWAFAALRSIAELPDQYRRGDVVTGEALDPARAQAQGDVRGDVHVEVQQSGVEPTRE